MWVPGGIGVTSGNASGIVTVEAANTTTSTAAVNSVIGLQPGYNFAVGTSNAMRCVAACLQVYWPGTESNRQGYISYGTMNGNNMVAGTSYTMDNLSTLFNMSERIPTDYVEYKWRPSDGDQLFTNPLQSTPTPDLARKGALGFVIKGIPVSTGVRVRLVAVMEWQPLAGEGVTVAGNSRNTSVNSLDHVINYLDSAGDWMLKAGHVLASGYRAGRAALPYVQAVSYATQKMGGLLM
jgi:uncharacterized protein YaiE (UPF0345 family)